MSIVAKNLRKIREQNSNYSQQQVADYLGIKQSTYSNWESGINDVKSDFIPKLAIFFNANISDFFDNSKKVIKVKKKNIDKKYNLENKSIVLLLTDEDSINKVLEIFKDKKAIY